MRKCKWVHRLTAFLLCASVVASLPGVATAVQTVDNNDVVAQYDFEDQTLDSAPEGWNIVSTSGGNPDKNWVKVITDPENEDNQIVAVSATQSGFETHATLPFSAPVTGTARVSLRFCYPSDPALNPDGLPNSAGIHLFAQDTTSNPAVSLMNIKGSLGHRWGAAPSSDRALAPLELDVWYDLIIDVDAQANTYSVYLDGVKLKEEDTEVFTFRNAQENVGGLRLAAPKGYMGTLYADDILVTTNLGEAITALSPLEPIQVSYGTPFEELPLPETVMATLEGGSQVQLPVEWDKGDYNSSNSGSYHLTGNLVLTPDYANPDALTPTISVTVGEDTTEMCVWS